MTGRPTNSHAAISKKNSSQLILTIKKSRMLQYMECCLPHGSFNPVCGSSIYSAGRTQTDWEAAFGEILASVSNSCADWGGLSCSTSVNPIPTSNTLPDESILHLRTPRRPLRLPVLDSCPKIRASASLLHLIPMPLACFVGTYR
jgi:hypothetical protein